MSRNYKKTLSAKYSVAERKIAREIYDINRTIRNMRQRIWEYEAIIANLKHKLKGKFYDMPYSEITKRHRKEELNIITRGLEAHKNER